MTVNYHLVAWTTLVVGGLLYLLNTLSYHRRSRGAKRIPGPRGKYSVASYTIEFSISSMPANALTGLPFVGNIFDLDGPHLIPTFNRWAAEYGPIVAFDTLGTKQIVLSTEKAANDLLVKRGNIYSGRGVPTALAYATRDLVTFLMQRTGTYNITDSRNP